MKVTGIKKTTYRECSAEISFTSLRKSLAVPDDVYLDVTVDSHDEYIAIRWTEKVPTPEAKK